MWFAIILGIFLIMLAAFMLVIEIFVPSFGVLTFCALASLAGGIWLFFQQGPAVGWIGVGIAIVVVPIVWVITYRMFPKTRFGKGVTLQGPKRHKGDAIPDTPELAEMLGQNGVVISPLRPVGMCDFQGQRLECVAETGFIEKGKTITVIQVEGTQLTVRLLNNN